MPNTTRVDPGRVANAHLWTTVIHYRWLYAFCGLMNKRISPVIDARCKAIADALKEDSLQGKPL